MAKTLRTTPTSMPPEGVEIIDWEGNAWRVSATELREMRRLVRFLTSMIAHGGRVTEQPGGFWAADFERRIIFWRPSNPWPPHRNLTLEDLRFLIGHEAGHLEYTGGYDWPEWLPKNERERFHRLVNAVEDIRIERLLMKRFGGFAPARQQFRDANYEEWKTDSYDDWSPLDQVSLSWLEFSAGHPDGLADQEWLDYARAKWPEIDRLANAHSTADVARGLHDIYAELRQHMPPVEDEEGTIVVIMPSGGSGSGQGDPGRDEPSDSPSKRKLGAGQKPLTAEEQLKGMAADAQENSIGKDQLEEKVLEEDAEKETGEHAAEQQGAKGMQAGTTRGSRNASNEALWDSIKERHRGEIVALHRKLRAVLKTNAADNWSTGHRRGQLHSRKAYRASAGDPRIFRKRTEFGALDYTLGILIDRSGSMGYAPNGWGTKSNAMMALESIVIVLEAWNRAGLESFALPWDTAPTVLYPIEGALQVHRGHLAGDIGKPSGGTYEAPALVVAQDEFSKVHSGHRLLFCISDGITTNIPESKQLVKELQESGIRCVAVGVGIDPPAHWDVRLRVESAIELAQVMPRFINELVRKGGK